MLRRCVCAIAGTGLLALAGCSSAQSTFDAHGPAARSIGGLSWFMTILFLIISVVMWLLIGYAFYQATRLAPGA